MTQQVNNPSRGNLLLEATIVGGKILFPAVIAAIGATVGSFFLGFALMQWSEAVGAATVMGLPAIGGLVTFFAVVWFQLKRHTRLSQKRIEEMKRES